MIDVVFYLKLTNLISQKITYQLYDKKYIFFYAFIYQSGSNPYGGGEEYSLSSR